MDRVSFALDAAIDIDGLTHTIVTEQPSEFASSHVIREFARDADAFLRTASTPSDGVTAAPDLTSVPTIPGTTNIGQGATIPTDLGQGSLSIGNRVFLDTDGDGVFTKYVDTTIGDVLVSLYRDLDGDGVADGSAIATSTTCGCGLYGFTGLAAGDYIVVIGQANLDSGALAGLYSLAGAANANDGVDGDDNGMAGPIGIQSGTIHLTENMTSGGTWSVDFGFSDVPQDTLDVMPATALSDDEPCIPNPDDGIFCVDDPPPFFFVVTTEFNEDQERVVTATDLGYVSGNSVAVGAAFISTINMPFLRFMVGGVDQNGWIDVADLVAGRVTAISTPNFSGSYTDSPDVNYYDSNHQLIGRAAYSYLYVHPVNDAPVGTATTRVIDEDTSHILARADFGFSDPVEGDAFAGVVFAAPTGGRLMYDADGAGSAPTVELADGAFVSIADIDAGRLSFVPTADVSGIGAAGFTFQVRDTGGTTRGGVDTDPTPRSFTFDINPLNDLPRAALPNSLSYTEGSGAQRLAPTATVSDPDGNWGGGKLVVTGLLVEDRVTIASVGDGAGEVRVAGTTVYYEGVAVGTFLGGEGSNFALTFAGNATDAVVQAVTRSLTYSNVSDTPTPARDLSINLFDSTGAGLNGFGGFTRLGGTNPFGTAPSTVPYFGDVNADGKTDYIYVEASYLQVMLGDGAGNYMLATGGLSGIVSDYLITGVAIIDADGDGDVDVVLGTEFGFGWIEQLPGGTWGGLVMNQFPVAGSAVTDDALSGVRLAFGDIDGDGDVDLVTTDQFGIIHSYRNDGGTFTVQAEHAFPSTPLGEMPQPVLLDYDGDGDLDLVIGSFEGLRLFANEDGAYVEQTGADNPFGGDYGNLSSGDYDNDGDLDLIVVNDSSMTVFRNDTPPGQAVTVNVTAVNDAPAGADVARTIDEDSSYTFQTGDFTYSDAEGDSLLGVRITTLPASGAITLSGLAVSEGQIISLADIASGGLVYTPPADGAGAGYGSFTFQLQDDGGTANGGVDVDPTPRAFTLNVTNTPDLPQAMLPNSLTYVEGSGPQLLAPAAIAFDPDANWGGGKLVVTGVLSTDRITLVSVGDGPGEVRVAGTNVYYEGQQVGSFTGGNGNNLVLTFGANATNVSVQAITRSLAYASTSEDPSVHDLSLNLIDSTGASLGGLTSGLNRVDQADNPIADVEAVPTFGDLDGDGDVDFVQYGIGGLNVWLQQPDGSYSSGFNFPHPLNGVGASLYEVSRITLVDADADGDLDLVLTSIDGFGWVEQTEDGWAPLATGSFPITTGEIGLGASFADVDGDGDADLVTSNLGGEIRYYRNDAGTFVQQTGADNPFPQPGNEDGLPMTPTLVDIDADGDYDLLYGMQLGGAVRLFLNQDGQFVEAGPEENPFYGVQLGQVGTGDYDNDGDLDLFFTDAAGTFLYRNDTPVGHTITIDARSVNDAPSGADAARTIDEDAPYTFLTGDFPLADIESNAFAGIVITTVPATGTLTLDGNPVVAGQSVPASAIAAGHLVFTPAANGNGTGYASFTFQVRDSGGTANGGTDLDPTPRGFSFDVISVNDAPTGTDKQINLLEDGAHRLTESDFGYGDPDGNGFTGVTIVAVNGQGTLWLDGEQVQDGQFIAIEEIRAGALIFVPDADANGEGAASFTFAVHDDGGTANGGVDIAVVPNTISFGLTPVNDAPAGADVTQTIAEDSAHVFTIEDFGFVDGDGDVLAEVVIETLPLAGTLWLDADGNGGEGPVAVTAGQVIAASAIAAGRLYFVPAPDANGAGYASFGFRLRDNAGTAWGGADLSPSYSFTFDVAAVDDPAAATGDLASVAENATVSIEVLANDADPDGGPADTIAEIDGQIATVGVAITLDSGARVTLNADGRISYDPHGAFDWLISPERAAATGAANGQAVDSFTYRLSGGGTATVAVTVSGVDRAGDPLIGTDSDDVIVGDPTKNYFDLSLGGSDRVTGGLASDGFFMGDQLDAGDRLDGGAGNDDQVGLSGDTVVVLQDDTIRNIETLVVLSGSGIPVREGAPPAYHYDITSADGNVAAGQRLTINANQLAANESIRFDGSAETDGSFMFYAGLGDDMVNGGSNADAFFFGNGGRFTGADRIDGGAGEDQVGLRGDYSAQVVLQAATITNIETLVLISAYDTRYAAGSAAFHYNLALHDGNLAANGVLTINGNALRPDERMIIDGSAETDGHFRFYAGAGDDILIGGAGEDEFYGRLGADTLTGGGGDDVFVYRSVQDTLVGAQDHITDFSAGDRIDLSAIDANTSLAGNNVFAFIGGLAFSNTAGELRIFEENGSWHVEADVDGDGVADLAIQVTTVGHALDAGDFIL